MEHFLHLVVGKVHYSQTFGPTSSCCRLHRYLPPTVSDSFPVCARFHSVACPTNSSFCFTFMLCCRSTKPSWLGLRKDFWFIVTCLGKSIQFSFRRYPELFSLILFQASGYGSGDDGYEDMERGDEVKKVVEEREYTLVCTHTHTHTTLSLCPSQCVGLASDQIKQLLSLQAWWRLEHSDMCCSLKQNKNTTRRQKRGGVRGVLD